MIQPNKDYLIQAHFYEKGGLKNMQQYLGNISELQRTIGRTWLNVSHTVDTKENNVEVRDKDNTALAIFTFILVPEEHPLPDHF
jgi:hypothetical protein